MLECIPVSLCTDDVTGFNLFFKCKFCASCLVLMCVCVCVRARAHVRVCVCVRVCV